MEITKNANYDILILISAIWVSIESARRALHDESNAKTFCAMLIFDFLFWPKTATNRPKETPGVYAARENRQERKESFRTSYGTLNLVTSTIFAER